MVKKSLITRTVGRSSKKLVCSKFNSRRIICEYFWWVGGRLSFKNDYAIVVSKDNRAFACRYI